MARTIRVLEMEGAFRRDTRASAPVCGDCPKYDEKLSWCPVVASRQRSAAPACLYGISIMRPGRTEEL